MRTAVGRGPWSPAQPNEMVAARLSDIKLKVALFGILHSVSQSVLKNVSLEVHYHLGWFAEHSCHSAA